MKFCENCKYLTWILDGFAEQSKILLDFVNKTTFVTKKKREKLWRRINDMYEEREKEFERLKKAGEEYESKNICKNETCEVSKKTV